MNITIKTKELEDNTTRIEFTVMEKDSDDLWTIWDESEVIGNKHVTGFISKWLGGLLPS